LGSDLKIYGFEWLFKDLFQKGELNARHATSYLALALLNRGRNSFIDENSKVFLNIDTKFLASGMIEFLPKNDFVFDVSINSLDMDVIRHMKSKGYNFSLDNIDFNSDWQDIVSSNLNQFSYLKIISSSLDENDKSKLDLLKTTHKIIAHKVESKKSLEVMKNLGIEQFQGYYISEPTIVPMEMVELSKKAVNGIYMLLQASASRRELAEYIDKFDDIKYYFLSYCNNFELFDEDTYDLIGKLGKNSFSNWVLILVYSKVAV
jgi:EAL and modified HD-GYP domain-containing signal transduction protein